MMCRLPTIIKVISGNGKDVSISHRCHLEPVNYSDRQCYRLIKSARYECQGVCLKTKTAVNSLTSLTLSDRIFMIMTFISYYFISKEKRPENAK